MATAEQALTQIAKMKGGQDVPFGTSLAQGALSGWLKQGPTRLDPEQQKVAQALLRQLGLPRAPGFTTQKMTKGQGSEWTTITSMATKDIKNKITPFQFKGTSHQTNPTGVNFKASTTKKTTSAVKADEKAIANTPIYKESASFATEAKDLSTPKGFIQQLIGGKISAATAGKAANSLLASSGLNIPSSITSWIGSGTHGLYSQMAAPAIATFEKQEKNTHFATTLLNAASANQQYVSTAKTQAFLTAAEKALTNKLEYTQLSPTGFGVPSAFQGVFKNIATGKSIPGAAPGSTATPAKKPKGTTVQQSPDTAGS